MSLTFLLYLTNVLHHLSCALGSIIIFICIITGVIIFIFIFGVIIIQELSKDIFLPIINFYKKYYLIFIFIAVIECIIPSKKTMYLMLGTNYLENATIPKKVSEILNIELDEVLKQLKEIRK